MKKTIQIELTLQEVEQAVIYWLKNERKIDAKSVHFHVEEEYDPDDWQGRYGPTYSLSTATATAEEVEDEIARRAKAIRFSPKLRCENCYAPVTGPDDHWVDDGPNRSSWGCP